MPKKRFLVENIRDSLRRLDQPLGFKYAHNIKLLKLMILTAQIQNIEAEKKLKEIKRKE
jgi:hypothetical protein